MQEGKKTGIKTVFFVKRLEKVREVMREHRLDGLILTTMDNVRWLSGFTGSTGTVLLAGGRAYFLTDSRYTIQAGEETRGFIVKEYSNVLEGITNLAQKFIIERLGFERRGILYQEYLNLRSALRNTKLVSLGVELEEIRARKDSAELGLLSQAIGIASRSFRQISGEIVPGASEKDLALKLEISLRRNGSGSLPFEVIVASGPHAALPHARPTGRKINRGECVIIDFGASFKGYQSDTTRTFIAGRPSRRAISVYQAVKGAHDRAIEKIRPGTSAKEADGIARGYLRKKGLGKFFRHGLGHGTGLNIHEAPLLSPRSESRIEEGTVVTVEPGVYIPGWGGVRIEDMVMVKGSGCEVLTGSMEIQDYGH